MFWFLSGMIAGAFLYRAVNKRTEPDYSSIAYTKSQIMEHEMMASYYKTILDNCNKPILSTITKKQM